MLPTYQAWIYIKKSAGNAPSIWCFPSELHIYDIEGISSLSPTLVDPARVSVIRAVDDQDTGLSAQLSEKN